MAKNSDTKKEGGEKGDLILLRQITTLIADGRSSGIADGAVAAAILEAFREQKTMSAADYIERALADSSFGDPRQDKLAMAALKFTGEDGQLGGKKSVKAAPIKGVKEQRSEAAAEVGANGRYQPRAAPGMSNGSSHS